MSCLVIAEFPAKQGKLGEMKALIDASLPGLIAFDGCISAEVYEEMDANTLIVVENFESLERYDAYLKWTIGNGIQEKLEPILEGGAAGLRVRRFGEALD